MRAALWLAGKPPGLYGMKEVLGLSARRGEEVLMIALWVKVRVKPARERLQAIEVDALGSERDEPGCYRFNVLQDQEDQNVYYFYEVYRDEAALEEHRKAPHYAVWRAAADTLDGPVQAIRTSSVFPAAATTGPGTSSVAVRRFQATRFNRSISRAKSGEAARPPPLCCHSQSFDPMIKGAPFSRAQ